MKIDWGYTLVEIVLAITILGLVLVPILTFMSNSSGLITHADIREMAILIAQQRMEILKSEGYESMTIGSTSYSIGDTEFPDYDVNRYPVFSLTENVSWHDDNIKKLKEIEIIISWNDNNKSVILKSNMAKR